MRSEGSICQIRLLTLLVVAVAVSVGLGEYVTSACNEACTGYSSGCATNPGECRADTHWCGGVGMPAFYQKDLDVGYAFCESADPGADCQEWTTTCAKERYYMRESGGACLDLVCEELDTAKGCD